jgi:hypothetical protein
VSEVREINDKLCTFKSKLWVVDLTRPPSDNRTGGLVGDFGAFMVEMQSDSAASSSRWAEKNTRCSAIIDSSVSRKIQFGAFTIRHFPGNLN